MPTTTWDALDDDVLPEIPGALPAFVRNHVKLAAIEFCKRAWVWLNDQGPIPVLAGTAKYSWTGLPDNTAVARVLQAWLDKKKLTPKTRNELSCIYGDYTRATGGGLYIVADLPSSVIIVPNPTSASTDTGLTAKVAIAPTRAAAGVDTEVFERYFDSIAMGAKARLLVMSRKPWTDVPRGQQLRNDFELAIAVAKTDVLRSYAGARLRVRGQYF